MTTIVPSYLHKSRVTPKNGKCVGIIGKGRYLNMGYAVSKTRARGRHPPLSSFGKQVAGHHVYLVPVILRWRAISLYHQAGHRSKIGALQSILFSKQMLFSTPAY